MTDQKNSRAARRRAARGRPAPPSRPPWIWIGLGVIVIAAAVIAVIASSGSDDGSDKVSGSAQTRAVEVSGSPLPVYGSGGDPAVGTPAPELRGASFDGTPVNITHNGRPKLVVFVAHWCPHCQREVPLLVDYLRNSPIPAGMDLVAVATSTSADRPNYPPSKWLEREAWPSPVLADSSSSDAARAFGLPGFPYFVAIDSSGLVVERTSGELPVSDFDALVARLAP